MGSRLEDVGRRWGVLCVVQDEWQKRRGFSNEQLQGEIDFDMNALLQSRPAYMIRALEFTEVVLTCLF